MWWLLVAANRVCSRLLMVIVLSLSQAGDLWKMEAQDEVAVVGRGRSGLRGPGCCCRVQWPRRSLSTSRDEVGRSSLVPLNEERLFHPARVSFSLSKPVNLNTM